MVVEEKLKEEEIIKEVEEIKPSMEIIGREWSSISVEKRAT